MKKLFFYTIIISLLFCSNVFAQHKTAVKSKSQFKIYANKLNLFSFAIPAGWKIVSSGDGENYNCIPLSKAEKETYADYNGNIFDLKVIKTNLDSATDGVFKKDTDGDYYYNSPMGGTKKGIKIKGKGFTGLKETHSCRVDTKEDNGQTDSTVVDGCEQIYLSNGKITLAITTNGIELDDDVYDKLIKTLNFYN